MVRMSVIVLIQLAADLQCQSQSGHRTPWGRQRETKGQILISPLAFNSSRLRVMRKNGQRYTHTQSNNRHTSSLCRRRHSGGSKVCTHSRWILCDLREARIIHLLMLDFMMKVNSRVQPPNQTERLCKISNCGSMRNVKRKLTLSVCVCESR